MLALRTLVGIMKPPGEGHGALLGFGWLLLVAATAAAQPVPAPRQAAPPPRAPRVAPPYYPGRTPVAPARVPAPPIAPRIGQPPVYAQPAPQPPTYAQPAPQPPVYAQPAPQPPVYAQPAPQPAFYPAPLAPPADPAQARLEGLRRAIQQMMAEDPTLFAAPVFSETPTELLYAFGGVNRPFLEGPDEKPTALGLVGDSLARVELLRRANASDPNAAAYWGPVLDQVESTIVEELAVIDQALAQGGADQLVARLEPFQRQEQRILAGAIERVAASRGKRATPAPANQVWRNPVTVTQELQTTTQMRTSYITQRVPVTRYITEYVTVDQPQGGSGTPTFGPQAPRTTTVPRQRAVTEMVDRQVAVSQPYTTSTPVSITRERRRFKLQLLTDPVGPNVYYLDRFNYLVFLGTLDPNGQMLKDDYANWTVFWRPVTSADLSVLVGESTYYYFRAVWPDGRRNRTLNNVEVQRDEQLPLKPDPL